MPIENQPESFKGRAAIVTAALIIAIWMVPAAEQIKAHPPNALAGGNLPVSPAIFETKTRQD